MILLLIMLLLAGGALCAVSRAGESDGIANYNYIEGERKQ